MSYTFEQTLETLGEYFYQPISQTHIRYSTRKKSTLSRPDFIRKIAQAPAYWKTRETAHTGRVKKKIVLSNISLTKRGEDEQEGYYKYIRKLISAGFLIYMLNKDNKFILIDPLRAQDNNYLEWMLKNSIPLHRNALNEILIKKGKNPEEYSCLDHYLTQRMLCVQKDFIFSIDIDVEMAQDSAFWLSLSKFIPIDKLEQINLISNEFILNHQKIFSILNHIQSLNKKNFCCLCLRNCRFKILPNLSGYPRVTQLNLNLSKSNHFSPNILPPAIKKLKFTKFGNGEVQLGLLNFSPFKQLTSLTLHQVSSSELIIGKNLQKLILNTHLPPKNLSNLLNFPNLLEISLMNLTTKNIISLSPTIQMLTLDHCVLELHNLSNCKNLTKINIVDCDNEMFETLKSLPNLRELSISSDKTVKQLPDLSMHKNLAILYLKNSCFTVIGKLPLHIKEIDILDCQLEQLPDFSGYPDLIKITNRNFKSIKSKNLPKKISSLDFGYCKFIQELPDLSEFVHLTEIILENSRIKNLKRLPPNIKYLHISDCESLTELPDLTNCLNVTKLDLDGCSNIKNIGTLPKHIKSLILTNCKSLNPFPDLSVCTHLTHLVLTLYDDQQINKLPPYIKTLQIEGTTSSFPNLSAYIYLKDLCVLSNSLTHLDLLPSNLETLNISTCGNLPKVLDFSRFPYLKFIEINKNQQCTNLPSGIQVEYRKEWNQTDDMYRTDQIMKHDDNMIDSYTKTPIDKTHILTNLMESKEEKEFKIFPAYKIRQHVFDEDNFLQSNLYLSQDDLNIKFTEGFTAQDRKNCPSGTGFCQLKLIQSVRWQPLPIRFSNDAIMCLAAPFGKEIRYNTHLNQYEIRWSDITSSNQAVEVQYSLQLRTQILKDNKTSNVQISESDKKFFYQMINEKISDAAFSPAFISFRKKLQSLISTSFLSISKIQAFCEEELVEYCKSFTNQDLSDDGKSLPSWQRILFETKGACRHRAYIFCKIARYLGVRARRISNECHEFVEIFDVAQQKWKSIELEGAFANIKNQCPKFSLVEKSDYLKTDENKVWMPFFQTTPKNYSNLEAVLTDILDTRQSLLIPVASIEQGRDLYTALTHHSFSKKNGSILYIESVADLIAAWKTYYIDSKGNLHYFAGPLQTLNPTGGHVVVNWARFKPEEIAAHQSLLDTPPTFQGHTLSTHLRIINLTTPNTQACEAFYSRSQLFDWPTDVTLPESAHLTQVAVPKIIASVSPFSDLYGDTLGWHEQFARNPKDSKTCSDAYGDALGWHKQFVKDNKKFKSYIPVLPPIDLYGDASGWYAKLVGDIAVQGKKYFFKPGKLVEAILNKSTHLVLTDAPLTDPDFQYFMTCLMAQRGLMVNGRWLDLPKGFTISYQDPKPPVLPKDIKQLSGTAWPPNSQDPTLSFHLNAHTLPLLLQQLRWEKEEWYTEPGWLDIHPHLPKYIIQTGELTDGELRQVYDAITAAQEKFGKDKYTLSWVDLTKYIPVPAPEAKGFLPAAWARKDIKQTGAQLLEVDDPTFVVNQLSIPFDLSVSIHAETSSADILEKIEEIKEEKNQPGSLTTSSVSSSFKVEIQQVAQALRDGKTVVLYGALSEELYRALEALFLSDPQLQLSEDKIPQPIKGRLLIVTKPVDFFPHLASQTQRHVNYANLANPWKAYEAQLQADDPTFSKENFHKIQLFYRLAAQLPHGQKGFPPNLRLTYQRIRQYLYLFKTQPNQDNPIGDCFLGDYHDKEAYAYLEVLSKLIFGPTQTFPVVNTDQLKDYEQTQNYFWQRLNCLNASALKIAIKKVMKDPSELDFYSPLPELCKMLATAEKQSALKNTPTEKSQIDIQSQMSSYLLSHRAIYLQGSPGTGKTFAAKAYANQKGRQAFWGGNEQQIYAWLNSDKDNSKEEHVLILDEANLNIPGMLEWLRPLVTLDEKNSDTSTYKVEFNQKTYTLTSRHKVIFTGNPGIYHDLLRDTPTLNIKPCTDQALLKNVLMPLYIQCFPMSSDSNQAKASQPLFTLLNIYRWVESRFPPGELSIRDLQSLAVRWMSYINLNIEISAEDQQYWLYRACEKEWSYRFNNHKDKIEFHQYLKEIFQKAPQVHSQEILLSTKEKLLLKKLPKNFYLTDQQKKVLLALSEDIDFSQNKRYASFIKVGSLIEGDSGFGKSELLRQLLLAKGYQPCQPQQLLSTSLYPNLQGHFIQFTTSGNAAEDENLLRAAFMKGCIVLLDELNLCPNLDTFLNHLMTGRTPENKLPNYSGFRIMATQNSLHHVGRKKVNEGLFNRFHAFHVAPHTTKDLCDIAQQAFPEFNKKSLNEGLVSAYLHAKSESPHTINTRQFYKGIKRAQENIDFLKDLREKEAAQTSVLMEREEKPQTSVQEPTSFAGEQKKPKEEKYTQKKRKLEQPTYSSTQFFGKGSQYLKKKQLLAKHKDSKKEKNVVTKTQSIALG